MGDQFATCGIGIRPPDDRINESGINELCPKLVPGQVVEVPEGHNIINQASIEIVQRIEKDEILRPIVFPDGETADMADPSKRKLGIEAIRERMAMLTSAVDHRAAALAARQELGYDGERGHVSDDPRAIQEDFGHESGRADNRMLRDAKDDAEPIAEGDPVTTTRRRTSGQRRGQ